MTSLLDTFSALLSADNPSRPLTDLEKELVNLSAQCVLYFAWFLYLEKDNRDLKQKWAKQEIERQNNQINNKSIEQPILTNREFTDTQIETIKELIKKQIQINNESTDKQIQIYKEFTDKQIETVEKVIKKQIQIYNEELNDKKKIEISGLRMEALFEKYF